MVSCSSLTALVFGKAEEEDAVLYFEPIGADDSGFVVLREDAPRLGAADDTPWELLCFDCVLDSWPGIGRGFDLAREHGGAEFAAGEWRAGVPEVPANQLPDAGARAG
jgi:hypothetical protein